MSEALILEAVSKSFPQRGGEGRVVAVNDVSLTIPTGEFVTLLGPSGCGKTTTLRLIAGFEMPTSGRIILGGKEVTHVPPNKRDMAMVFQSYALFPHMSVYENIAYGLQIRRLSRAQIREKVQSVLDLVGLTQLGQRRPNQLSGGQQQRVALARALVMDSRVLLFDEPLSNLDAKLRVQMRGEIHRIQRRLNITSIYVTHDQVEAMAMSDRIVVMNAGRIEQIGTPRDIYRWPTSRFVADFIGRANFVETRAESVSGESVTVTLLGQQVRVTMASPPSVGSPLTAVLRPEGLKLRADSQLTQAQVEQAMYLGTELEYMVRLGEQTLIVVENDPRDQQIFAEGETVGVDVIPDIVHLLPAQVG
jgi:iron(III) transport system ATP-binding protein